MTTKSSTGRSPGSVTWRNSLPGGRRRPPWPPRSSSARDVLQAGEVDDRVEAQRPPDGDADQRDPGPRQLGGPRRVVGQPDRAEQAVDQARGSGRAGSARAAPTTATPSTYGAKKTARKNVRPGNLRFSSSASSRAGDDQQRHAEHREDRRWPACSCQKASNCGDAAVEQVEVVVEPDERLVGQQEVPVVQADPEPEERRAPARRSRRGPGSGARNRYGVSGAVTPSAPAGAAPAAACRVPAARPRRATSSHGCQPPYFLRLSSRISSAWPPRRRAPAFGSLRSTASLTRLVESAPARRRCPATGGGKCRSSICVRERGLLGERLELGALADALRAGTWPPLAHSSDCWLIQLMNTLAGRAACSRPGCAASAGRTGASRPRRPGWLPICGSGATPHSRPDFSLRVLIVQMPFQLNAVLPFWSAIVSASWPIFGLVAVLDEVGEPGQRLDAGVLGPERLGGVLVEERRRRTARSATGTAARR